MNVTVENLGPCKKLLRVEVAVPEVDAAFGKTTDEFQRKAKLPGFRPGKVPRSQVEKAFAKEIDDETKRKLISESYSQAVRDQKLHIIGRPDLEEIQFGRNQTLQFAVTVETAPDFELPEYRGLVARVPDSIVTQADMDRAMTVLREKRTNYPDVSRQAQADDFIVINYTGRCEDKPINQVVPTAKSLTEQKDFWVQLTAGAFLPGFTEQLIGAQAGERRTVAVEFPADIGEPALAGKKGQFDVEILQVKERHLPDLDDQFAIAYGAKNMDALREGVRADLQDDLNRKRKTAVRSQILKSLLGRVDFDLPESVVETETRNVVTEVVHENQQRGISNEAIEEKKNEIYAYANASAKDQLKLAFMLGRIAEKEGIRVSEQELAQQVVLLAQQYKMSPDKLMQQLKERNGLVEIEEQIIKTKVIDLLQLYARTEESTKP